MVESPSLQSIYAMNLLDQLYGYPLRSPEPISDLPPSYQENGLHIGDVGFVDGEGIFQVLFNICFSPDHELHRDNPDLVDLVNLTKLDPKSVISSSRALPPGRDVCHGVRRSPSSADPKDVRRFTSHSASGAMLVLPFGAARQYLSENEEKKFLMLAKKHAVHWCRFADRKSLYLITGSHKTSSWHLASFRDIFPSGQVILVYDETSGKYNWHSGCDFRDSGKNCTENQTVFISGFKIEVRDIWYAKVEKLWQHPSSIWSILMQWLANIFVPLASLVFLYESIIMKIPASALSPPFHPLDIINHYKMCKNPNAHIAITHDNEWINMLEMKKLTSKEMAKEEYFWAFLEENYIVDPSSDDLVYILREVNQLKGRCNGICKVEPSSKMFVNTCPENQQFVITYMRAENIATHLGNVPMSTGFYILVEFNGTKKRSKCKPASQYDDSIEWSDKIILPIDSKSEIRFLIVASFEFDPVLGNGKTLYTVTKSVSELAHARSPFGLSAIIKGDKSHFTLCFTCEEQQVDSFSNCNHGSTSEHIHVDHLPPKVIEETDKGHHALLCYHQEGGIEKLEDCVKCFELALAEGHCSRHHKCYPAAQFNLATARLLLCQAHGNISELDYAINSYRTVLDSRQGRHLDRPKTLLHLAQALLYRQEKLWWQESDEIEHLATEIKMICSESSYDHRAAVLITQTLKRHRILTTGKLVELEELVLELDSSARTPPDWHLDKPQRLINLSTALLKQFELTDDLRHLEKSISTLVEAIEFVPDIHHDKPWMLAFHGDLLRARSLRCGEFADLEKSISKIEDALKRVPVGHVDKPWILASLGDALLVRFKQSGDVIDMNRSISVIEQGVKLTPDGNLKKPRMLVSLGDALHIRFVQFGNFSDLEGSISMIEKSVKLTTDDQLDKPWMLTRLGVAFLARFFRGNVSYLGYLVASSTSGNAVRVTPEAQLGWLGGLPKEPQVVDVGDVEQAISRHRDAAKLFLDDTPHKSGCLINLAGCLYTRFWYRRNSSDLEEAISLYQGAAGLVPDGQPDKRLCLNNLALALRTRFEQSGMQNDIEEAVSRRRSAIDVTPGAFQNLGSSLELDAFSVCLRNGASTKAVELLEEGREAFWSQLVRLPPLEDIIPGHRGKALSDEFGNLTSRIRDILYSTDVSNFQVDRASRLNVELRRAASDIRLPGLSGFPSALRFSDLRKAAEKGPVIIVNASEHGCDALIILYDKDPFRIPLKITKDRARHLSSKFHALNKQARIDMYLRPILRELWDEVVSPIVTFLLTTYPSQSRIWWYPTAEFSLLPLHAAGPYKWGQKKLSDLYISSYTTTLTALIQAGQRTPSDFEALHFVAIGQSKDPANEFRPVVVELTDVGQRVNQLANFRSIEGSDSCISRVVDELGKNQWVHFACSAVSNREQPLKSAFVLHDGHLMIEHILRRDVRNQFVYISARRGAGAVGGADETVHLATAMQFSGFRSVIGTIWAVDNDLGDRITSTFYDNVTDARLLDHTHSANALHATLKRLEYRIPFGEQINYIHLGA